MPGEDHGQHTITMVAVLAISGHQVMIFFNISSLWQVDSRISANKTGSHGKLQSCLYTCSLRHLLQGMYPCQYALVAKLIK